MMCCNNTDISEKLLLYAEGSLSEDEKKDVEKHLEQCSSCREQVAELKEITESLKSNSTHIKNNWIHIAPQDLVILSCKPESIDAEKRKAMEDHLHLCDACRGDFELIGEAPTTVGDMPPVEVEMPDSLKADFIRLYGSKGQTGGSLADDFSRMLDAVFGGLFKRPVRIAYAVAILAVVFLGANFLKTGTDSFRDAAAPVVSKYLTIETSHLSPDNRTRFVDYLNRNHISVHFEGDRVMVARDQKSRALSLLSSFGKNTSWEPAMVLDEGDRDEDFFYRMPGKASMLVSDEKGEYPKDAPSSVYGRQPVISAFSVLEDRESDEILKRYSRQNPSMVKTDMVERDRETTRIQDDFSARAGKVLKSSTDTENCPVKVYITLSLHRDNDGKYQIQSVTVIIEKSAGLSDSRKEQIKEKIRRALEWKTNWDETFLFVG